MQRAVSCRRRRCPAAAASRALPHSSVAFPAGVGGMQPWKPLLLLSLLATVAPAQAGLVCCRTLLISPASSLIHRFVPLACRAAAGRHPQPLPLVERPGAGCDAARRLPRCMQEQQLHLSSRNAAARFSSQRCPAVLRADRRQPLWGRTALRAHPRLSLTWSSCPLCCRCFLGRSLFN